MAQKKQSIDASKLTEKEPLLKQLIAAALDQELASCAIPDLPNDPNSGSLWSSLPVVDSKTAHKISASIIEQVLGCKFEPKWIRKGGYSSVAEAVADVINQLRTHYTKAPEEVVA